MPGGANASAPDAGVDLTRANSPGKVLGAASQIAAHDAELVQRLDVTTDGWRLEAGGATSPGWRSALPDELGSRLGATADIPFTIAIGQSDTLRLTVKAEGARSVPLDLDAGRAAFLGAYESTDLLYATDLRRVEAFYLLRDERAPTSFTWRVERGQGLFSTEQAEDGSLYFYDDRHVGIFRIPPPVAIDAAGLKRAGTLEWTGERVRFSIDTKGMTFPVLLDPATIVVDWSQQSAASLSAGGLVGTAMAYDAVRTRTVMFGGRYSAGNDNSTYEWEGGTSRFKLTNLTGTRPALRSYHGLAYDSTRQATVLFGGMDAAAKNDTWEWNGTAWSQKCSTTPCSSTLPGARERFVQVFHAGSAKTVVFGGRSGATNYGDTWTWNGLAWVNACTGACATTAPAARWGAAGAYDSTRKVAVLFGGTTNGTAGNAQTYEWSGTAWTARAPATVPPARWGATMAYDTNRGVVVMFGGQSAATNFLNDTWEWDGTNWTQRAPATVPGARSFAAAAPYQVNILMFGGTNSTGAQLNDSWYYQWFGGTCTVNAQCPPPPGGSTGYCVDNVCCNNACDGGTLGNCQACSIARGAAQDGVCGTVAVNFPCEDGSLCTTGEVCNASQQCTGALPVNCTTPDACHTGPGQCAPSTGLCNYPYAGNGTPLVGGQPINCTVSGQVGLCAVGHVRCGPDANNVGSTLCDQITQPNQVLEVCNGVDDDCNDVIDNVISVGDACAVAGKLGPCAASAKACVNASGSWSLTCPQTVFAVSETCNGVDDNCDGTVDNGALPGVNDVCTVAGKLGVCSVSGEICQAGVLVCLQSVFPSVEVCNSLDDNCDGSVDEGLLNTVPNCGGCGMACSPSNLTAHCSAPGNCDGACNAGFLDCDIDKRTNGCEINGQTDPVNCGSCAGACSTNNISRACTVGNCTGACNANWDDCNANKRTDGCEKQITGVGATDVSNCGACARVCSANHVAQLCTSGICNGACATNFGDCNSNKQADGCEVQITGVGAVDVSNCGACGTVCSTNHVTAACAAGSCSAGTCAAGYDDCNANKQTDGCEIQVIGTNANNCGACGNVCSSNHVTSTACAVGVCTSPCAADFADCNANKLTDGCEKQITGSGATDVLNCGGCATVCSTNNITRACANGSCSAGTCAANFGDCNSNKQTDGCEVNLTNTTANCGTCGTDCSGLPHVVAASATCSASTCSFTCAAGFGDCDGNKLNGCETNLNTDAANCGSCGGGCSNNHATPSCNAGSCNSACVANYGDCNGNLRTDGCEVQISGTGASSVANCGGCGLACSSTHITSPVCGNGLCTKACDSGYTDCNALDVGKIGRVGGDGCEVATGTDANNCGGCGTACSLNNMSTRTCSGGVCNGSCTGGYADCDGNKQTNGCEVDLNNNVSNCSACGSACSTNNMSPAACGSGSCESGTCTTGYFNCNAGTYPTTSKRVDGCEVNGITDSSNCGGCGLGCSTQHVTTTAPGSDSVVHGVCSGSTCSSACAAGWGNCANGMQADGCETDLSTTTANCGSCGNNCGTSLQHTAGNSCSGGACVIGSCAGSWQNCNSLIPDGCEIDTATNGSNCSGCGRVCSTVNMTGGGSCAASACSGSCNLGFADCNSDKAQGGGNGCESTLSTVATCGTCAGVCSSGTAHATVTGCNYQAATPATSNCTFSCSAGYLDCNPTTAANNNIDGCEVNKLADPNNCNGCGVVCSAANMATRTCGDVASNGVGVCNGTCSAGFLDCDANKQTTGCETNSTNDSAQCGACNTACSTNHVATTAVSATKGTTNGLCSGGVCASACVTPAIGAEWTDCNANKQADGCETNFAVTSSCGSCSAACVAGAGTKSSAVTGCTDGGGTGSTNYCGFTCTTVGGFLYADCDATATKQSTHNTDGCESSLGGTNSCGTCLGVCSNGANKLSESCTYNAGSPAASTCAYVCSNDAQGQPSQFDCNTATAANNNADGCEYVSPYYYLDCDNDGYGGNYTYLAGGSTVMKGAVASGSGGLFFACAVGNLPAASTACATRLGGTWASASWRTQTGDCLDTNAAVNPGVAYEICGDGLDNDCGNGVDVPAWGKKFQTADSGTTVTTSGSSSAPANAINWAGTRAVAWAGQRLDGPVGAGPSSTADTTYGDVFKIVPTLEAIASWQGAVPTTYNFQIYFTNNAGQAAACPNQSDFEMSVYSQVTTAATDCDAQNGNGWGGGYTPGAGTTNAANATAQYTKFVSCSSKNVSAGGWWSNTAMMTHLSYWNCGVNAVNFQGSCTNELATAFWAPSNQATAANTFYVRIRRRPGVAASCNQYGIWAGFI